jgi:hypothetical protein
VVPFFVYTTVFLLIPTLVVVIGAFVDPTVTHARQPRCPRGQFEFLPHRARHSTRPLPVTAVVGATLVGGSSRMP